MTTMHDDLARSGLTPQDVHATEVPPTAFGTASIAYTLPYFMPDGTEHPRMKRTRLLDPPPGVGKYTQPSVEELKVLGGTEEEASLPYLNPEILGGKTTWNDVANDLTPKHLLIVEGEKKAVAAGLRLKRYAVGIGGCWMGVRRNPQGVCLLHPWIAALLHPGDTVEVVLDSDIFTNPDVRRAAGTLRRAIMRHGIMPSFVILPSGGGKPVGVDDWLRLVPAGNELAKFDELPRESDPKCELLTEDNASLWDYLGMVVAKGKPLPIELNASWIIKRHERYAGLLWYDQLKGFCYENSTGTPRTVGDEWLLQELHWVQEHCGFFGLAKGKLFDVVMSETYINKSRNPLLEEIMAARWDGTQRLEGMFIELCGADDTPYHRAVGRNWLVGAVARLCDPGCQFDNMLILEGVQGLRKSSALAILAGDYYVSLKGDITSKDFILAAHTGWISDIIELGALRRADVDHIKGEITTRKDSIRPPYGRVTVEKFRSFVLVGTTNTNQYLRDVTGNRRFWPIECKAVTKDKDTGAAIINTPWLVDNRTQLLAEAYRAYKLGHVYWEMPEAATEAVQEARLEDDPLVDTVGMILNNPSIWRQITYNGAAYNFVATSEIMVALNVRIENYASMMPKVSRAVHRATGWKRHFYLSKTKTISLNGGPTTLSARGYAYLVAGAPQVANVVPLPSLKKDKFAPS